MKIEEFKDITIAYMRNVGEYGSKNEVLMDTFKEFLRENNLFHDETVILGIALDNPATTQPNELRYDVGMITEKNQQIGLNTRKIDDGKYAIFDVIHTKEGVTEFWKNISNLTAGLLVDYSKSIMERYAMNKIANHLCEFCIPLK